MRELSVVILVGTPIDPAAALRPSSGGRPMDQVLAAAGAHTTVSLIAMRAPVKEIRGVAAIVTLENDPAAMAERVLKVTGIDSLTRALTTNRIGRVLASLSPASSSRVFRRAVQASPAAQELITAADVLIAADPPAVLAAWSALRSGKVGHAFHTIPAGARALALR